MLETRDGHRDFFEECSSGNQNWIGVELKKKDVSTEFSCQ